jgi:HlyD family secretion protein
MRATLSLWALLAGAGAALAAALHWLDPAPPEVVHRLAAVDRGPVQTQVLATGTVQPLVTTRVSTQVSGQVAEVLVDFNAPVRRGEVLARLDPQTFIARVRESEAELEVARAELRHRRAAVSRARAQLRRTRARVAVAESELKGAEARVRETRLAWERAQSLSRQGSVAESELEAARTALAQAEAGVAAGHGRLLEQEAEIDAADADLEMVEAQQALAAAGIRRTQAALDEARVNLARTEIRSPLDGVVIDRDVEAGQTVAASLQAPMLFTLAGGLERVRIETHVDEADIGRVRADQPALFTVDAYPDRPFTGRVSGIRKAPQLLHNVVTYTVLVDAENPRLVLFPGMTAVVRVVVEDVADAVRIPNAALRFVPRARRGGVPEDEPAPEGWTRVWRRDPTGEPRPLYVRTGAADEQYTAVLEGPVQPGDLLITGRVDAQ